MTLDNLKKAIERISTIESAEREAADAQETTTDYEAEYPEAVPVPVGIDSNFVYVRTAMNTVKRAALSAF